MNGMLHDFLVSHCGGCEVMLNERPQPFYASAQYVMYYMVCSLSLAEKWLQSSEDF